MLSSTPVRLGLKAYGSYSTSQTVKGYAKQLADGVALRSILLNVAIDAGINYAGGKIFKAAVKGIGKIGSKLVARFGGEGHHVIPKFLTGATKGRKVKIPRKIHCGKGDKSYHNILRKHLKKHFGDDMPSNLKTADFEKMFDSNLGDINKMKASQALMDAAAEFDEIHPGYDLTGNTVEALIEQWYSTSGPG